MQKTEFFGFRAEPQHERKIAEIQQHTGWKTSVILRKLIEGAHVGDGVVTIQMPIKKKDDALSLAGEASSVSKKGQK